MKKLLMMSAMLLLAAAAVAQKTVTIKGHVKFLDRSDFRMKVVRYEHFEKKVLAEAAVDSVTHNYEFKVTVDQPCQATLDCGGWQSESVWLDDENLEAEWRGADTARIKIKNPPYVYIKGGRKNEVMNLMNFQGYRSYQSMIAISQTVYRAQLESKRDSVTMPLYDYNYDNDKAYYRWITEHYADRNSVMAAIGRLSYDDDKALIDGAFKTLTAADPSSKVLVDEYLKTYYENKARKEKMEVGKPAPALTFQDQKGKKHKLSDFKGKVLVLDFWASWCGPCRAEVPNLKKYYADFDKKKVEFISVSIDEKKAAWTKALGEEGMTWQQGWVDDGGKQAMDDYQFSGIPFILVIDKDGNIYRKSVRGENIRKGVQDCLDGKAVVAPKTKTISMGAAMM